VDEVVDKVGCVTVTTGATFCRNDLNRFVPLYMEVGDDDESWDCWFDATVRLIMKTDVPLSFDTGPFKHLIGDYHTYGHIRADLFNKREANSLRSLALSAILGSVESYARLDAWSVLAEATHDQGFYDGDLTDGDEVFFFGFPNLKFCDEFIKCYEPRMVFPVLSDFWRKNVWSDLPTARFDRRLPREDGVAGIEGSRIPFACSFLWCVFDKIVDGRASDSIRRLWSCSRPSNMIIIMRGSFSELTEDMKLLAEISSYYSSFKLGVLPGLPQVGRVWSVKFNFYKGESAGGQHFTSAIKVFSDYVLLHNAVNQLKLEYPSIPIQGSMPGMRLLIEHLSVKTEKISMDHDIEDSVVDYSRNFEIVSTIKPVSSETLGKFRVRRLKKSHSLFFSGSGIVRDVLRIEDSVLDDQEVVDTYKRKSKRALVNLVERRVEAVDERLDMLAFKDIFGAPLHDIWSAHGYTPYGLISNFPDEGSKRYKSRYNYITENIRGKKWKVEKIVAEELNFDAYSEGDSDREWRNEASWEADVQDYGVI